MQESIYHQNNVTKIIQGDNLINGEKNGEKNGENSLQHTAAQPVPGCKFGQQDAHPSYPTVKARNAHIMVSDIFHLFGFMKYKILFFII